MGFPLCIEPGRGIPVQPDENIIHSKFATTVWQPQHPVTVAQKGTSLGAQQLDNVLVKDSFLSLAVPIRMEILMAWNNA